MRSLILNGLLAVVEAMAVVACLAVIAANRTASAWSSFG
jgi:hypothetical protein